VVFGAGSIVDAPTAAMYIAQGANFIVGPNFDRETALLCNIRKIPYLPGCGSVTEINEAEKYGVEICKVFPGGQVGGPDFVKAVVKGPCPRTLLMPTGGVKADYDSLSRWFEAGVACVGIGSDLITKEIVKNRDFNKLTGDFHKLLQIIKKVRKS